MQSSKREVAGFCNSQRRLDGFQISHFADQHHVWVFTEGGAKGVAEALGISVQLALVDHTILVHVDEFDRVLNRKNVVVTLGIDFVNHGRQRRRFA